MWIASGSGIIHRQQGIASGMASTTLNIGNAIGIALLTALSGGGVDNLHNEKTVTSPEHALQLAFYLAAIGLIAGLLVSCLLARKARGNFPAETA